MDKEDIAHIEVAGTNQSSESDSKDGHGHEASGTVRLFYKNDTVLIPTPSPDPKDPLNLPTWHKWAITIIAGAYSALAVLLTSGLGAISTTVFLSYPGQEARANDLLTYPTLFMGIGNLIAMPLALAIGRRPVFLGSMVILVASGIWCARSQSLGSHIAGRDIMSLAAGQSEALCPMMIQEIHFLHERGRKLSWFAAIQAIGTAALFLATTFLVSAWGWRWWYGLFTIVNGVILILSFFLVCETDFERPADASEGEVHLDFNERGDVERGGDIHKVIRVTTASGNVLDIEKYGPRTWKHNLRIFSVKPRWNQMGLMYKHVLQGLCIPSMLWLLLLNGVFLGIYVFQAATFAPILIRPPYSFPFQNLGFVQAGQIVDCLIFLPLLGYGTDLIIKYLSKRNNGVYEPEYRLIILSVPAIVGVICSIFFGRAGAHPENYSWGTVAVTYCASFFAFLGANIVGLTYAVDSFPLRAGSLLLVICAGRGFISFGLSYATLPAVNSIGYDGAMNVYAIVSGVLSLCAIPVYFYGRKIREFGQKVFRESEMEK